MLIVKCPIHGSGCILPRDEKFAKVYYCAFCEIEVGRDDFPKKPISIFDFEETKSGRKFNSLLELRESGFNPYDDSIDCGVEWEDGSETTEWLSDVQVILNKNKWDTPLIPDRYLTTGKSFWRDHYPFRHVYALKLSENIWDSSYRQSFPITINGNTFGQKIKQGEEKGCLYIGETGLKAKDGKDGVQRRFEVHMDSGNTKRAKVVNEHPFSRLFSECVREDLVYKCQDGNYASEEFTSVKVECWLGWKLNLAGYAIWGPAKTDMIKHQHLDTEGWT